MAGKKKGKVADQALSAKEIQKIKNSMAEFVKDPSSKTKHWATLAEPKKPAANKLYEELIRSDDYHGDPNDSTRAASAGASGPAATTGGPSASLPVSGTNVAAGPHGPIISTGDGGNASETEDSDEEIASDRTNAQSLVIKVNTDRRMPDASAAETLNSEGANWAVDDWDLVVKFQELTESDKETPFPIRSDFQPRGPNVFTNRFRVDIKPEVVLHEFEIVGMPSGLSRRMKKFYVDTAIDKSTILQNNNDYFATDYNKTIITWKDLRTELDEGTKWSKKHSGWHLVDIKDGQYHMLSLYLKHIRVVDTGTLERYVKSSTGDDSWNPLTWNQQADDNSPNKDTVINALNIVISKCFEGGVFRLGANKFFIEAGNEPLVGSPLSTIRGYFYSIRPGMGHILLNVNACTSAFLQPVTLDELMSTANQKLFGKDYPSFLTGLRVYIDYTRGDTSKAQSSDMNKDESRIKKISGLGKPCNEQKFNLKIRDAEGQVQGEEETNVATYLKDRYGMDLQHPELRAVNLGSRQRETWFAPEKLVVMPYQIYSRTVPGNLMKGMHAVACRMPEINRGLIEGEGMSKLRINASPVPPELQSIPITVSSKMFVVPSTTLKNPKIKYGSGQSFIMDASAQWDLADKEFLHTSSSAKKPVIRKYVVIHEKWVPVDRVTQIKNNFEGQMSSRNVGQAQNVYTGTVNLRDKARRLPDILRQELDESRKIHADLVILILQNRDQDVYSSFKYLADRIFGLHTMVFVERSNYKGGEWNKSGLDQYVGNIMMKANLKFQGINHTVESNNSNFGDITKTLDNTLVLGADVTHPSGGALPGCPSIAAVVGSVENTGGKFLGSIRLQGEANKEMIDPEKLTDMVAERVSDWYYENQNTYPKNILYYRDGVSDSQFKTVKDEEVPCIVEGFNAFVKQSKDQGKGKGKAVDPPEPKITALVVTKRHHTRFYPQKVQDRQDNNHNCKPGTLVERGVTSPYFADFYLQSHNGIKGTAKPAHYWLLQNDMGMNSMNLQYLTHNLCHTYVRATMGVSYAAPAYYADRLCERARCYIREFLVPSEEARKDIDDRRKREERVRGLLTPKKYDKEVEKNKTRAERTKEREELNKKKEEVEEALKNYVFDKAVASFSDDVNDRHYDQQKRNQLLKTMYWM